MTDKNGGGGQNTPQQQPGRSPSEANQPQGDPNATDFTANENALGGAPNNQPARDPQTGQGQSNG